MNNQKMIEYLLQSLTDISSIIDPFNQSSKEKQVRIWTGRVTSALTNAGMLEEAATWKHEVGQIDAGFMNTALNAQVMSLRAILVGIQSKLNQVNSEQIISIEIIEGTNPLIKTLVLQINGCYHNGWYDSCAAMMRRLVEVLLINCFEKHKIAQKIKDVNHNYYELETIIATFQNEGSWHISQGEKKYVQRLPEIKDLGNRATHGKAPIKKQSIDNVTEVLRVFTQLAVNILDR